MSRWTDKLRRLPPGVGGAVRAGAGEPSAPAPAAPEPAPLQGAKPVEPRALAADPLAELHASLAKLRLGQPLASSRPPATACSAETRQREALCAQFVNVGAERAPLWRRRLEVPFARTLGGATAHAARAAEPAFLALLALDPRLAECAADGAVFFDLESTGLAHGSIAFLVAMAYFERGALVCEQLLLRTLDDEAPLLAAVAERLAAAQFWVSFNGKSFDWPLLRGRMQLAKIAAPEPKPHLDLLHVAKRVHGQSRKLQQLERELLGMHRHDDIAGADVAAAYWHWQRTAQHALLGQIAEHNELDVLSLCALVGLYGAPPQRAALGEAKLDAFLPQLARTAQRAKALGEAAQLAERAVALAPEHGAGYLARAEVSRALKLRDRAMADFERGLAAMGRHASKGELEWARLQLAKLYEHHARRYDEALQLVAQGTAERPAAQQLRTERLTRKAAHSARRR